MAAGRPSGRSGRPAPSVTRRGGAWQHGSDRQCMAGCVLDELGHVGIIQVESYIFWLVIFVASWVVGFVLVSCLGFGDLATRMTPTCFFDPEKSFESRVKTFHSKFGKHLKSHYRYNKFFR